MFERKVIKRLTDCSPVNDYLISRFSDVSVTQHIMLIFILKKLLAVFTGGFNTRHKS